MHHAIAFLDLSYLQTDGLTSFYLCTRLCVCLCHLCADAELCQKRALRPLQLVLQTVVSHYVGPGKQSWVP